MQFLSDYAPFLSNVIFCPGIAFTSIAFAATVMNQSNSVSVYLFNCVSVSVSGTKPSIIVSEPDSLGRLSCQ